MWCNGSVMAMQTVGSAVQVLLPVLYWFSVIKVPVPAQ